MAGFREVKSQPLFEPFAEDLTRPIQSGLNRLRRRIKNRGRFRHAALLPFTKDDGFAQIFRQTAYSGAHGSDALGGKRGLARWQRIGRQDTGKALPRFAGGSRPPLRPGTARRPVV